MKRIRRRIVVMIASIIVVALSLLVSRINPGFFEDEGVSIRIEGAEILQEEDVDFVDLENESRDEEDFTDNVLNGVTNATVLHVVDGDTLDADLDGVGKIRVRLLGVNTPETVDPRKTVECFGKEASAYSKRSLVVGDRIRLVPDPQADERDKYGRLLRNVILDDGTDYNASLVEQGYAYAYLSFPLNPQRKTELKKLENEAKEAGRGLWGSSCK